MIDAKTFNDLQDRIAAAKRRMEFAAEWYVQTEDIGGSSAACELKAAIEELNALRGQRHQQLMREAV